MRSYRWNNEQINTGSHRSSPLIQIRQTGARAHPNRTWGNVKKKMNEKKNAPI